MRISFLEFEELEANRLYTYCHRCRENLQDMRGRIKGLGKVRHMKKYGSGKITEPQDLDVEQPDLPFEKTASQNWTPADEQALQEEITDVDQR